MQIRYPPGPLEGESRLEWERRALNPWRMEEKARLWTERGSLCERCEIRLATDLDEGIIPRCDMRGFSLVQRQIAFASCNLFLLCAQCNREEAHQREWAIVTSAQRYGAEAVLEWYASLELKAPRRDLAKLVKF